MYGVELVLVNVPVPIVPEPAPAPLTAFKEEVAPAHIIDGVGVTEVIVGLGLAVTTTLATLAQPEGPETPSFAATEIV